MFSFAFKQIVSVCVTKTETVLHPRMIFQRTAFTSKVLSSRVNQVGPAVELDFKELKVPKDPDDFGRVVEIDLEDIQSEPDVKAKKGRKKKETKGKSNKTVNDGEPIADVKQSEGMSEVKKKYEDLRNKSSSSFSNTMTSLKSKKGREKSGCIYLEGKRLIHDAIKAGYKPLKVYFSRPSDLEKLSLPEGIEVFRIPYKKLQFWSDVVTCQGVIGIFEMPDRSIKKETDTNCIPLTVVCDNVREPNNLGSILRVVSSVGCEKLILTQAVCYFPDSIDDFILPPKNPYTTREVTEIIRCVDLWEPKVLRCAAGAHFHLPILRSIPWAEVEEEIGENYKIVLATCGDEEVLNNNESSTFTTRSEVLKELPLKCYSSVDYRSQNTAIVIGGETHGLSLEAVEFAKKRKGLKVYIPMSNQIESLNNSVALGILSYMVRYQLESTADASHDEKENAERIEKN